MVSLVCLAGIALNCLIIGPDAMRSAIHGRNDFRLFYLGSRLVFNPGLYDASQALSGQQQLFGEKHTELMPVRLPFYYALLSPLGHLPYRAAFACWVALLILATASSLLLAPPRIRAHLAIACCWSLPLVFSLAIGQDVAFLLLALALSFHERRRSAGFQSGLALSLCLIKFHLFLLLPLLFTVKREWRVLAGWSAGAALWLGVSFWSAEWNWPKDYLALISRPEVSPGVNLMPNLRNLAGLFPAPASVEALLVLAVIAAWLRAIQKLEFAPALGATLTAGLLVSRHVYLPDCALLIPALILCLPVAAGLVRWSELTLLSVIPYLFILLNRGAVTAVWLLAVFVWQVTRRPEDRQASPLRPKAV